MRIAYLINQYPQVSHSFIRREILALESMGVEVTRFSIRRGMGAIVDPEDLEEQTKTQVLLDAGALGLAKAVIQGLLTNPQSWLQALVLAIQIGWKSDRGLLRHFVYFAEACVLKFFLKAAKVNHVHVHFGTNSAAVAMLCCILGGPAYSFTVHGPEEFDKAVLLSLDIKIRHAAFVVAISSFGKSQLCRYCPVTEWNKIHVIRCGVDAKFLEYTPEAIPNEPRLVCVGRLSEQKAHLVLLQAVDILARVGIVFELILVGDGPLRDLLQTQIEHLGLQQQIKLHGWADTETVRQKILAARALVLPSFAEGLPVVLMEALALQRPVISTYVAGIPELVVPGENGWLVPAGDVEKLAAALKEVLQCSTTSLEEFGRKGRLSISTQHNVNLEAKKLMQLFSRPK
jgi:glycosyltransferase involved in cell wall biosynthesis